MPAEDACGGCGEDSVRFIKASELLASQVGECRTPPQTQRNSLGGECGEVETGSSEHHRIKHARREEYSGGRNMGSHKALDRAFGEERGEGMSLEVTVEEEEEDDGGEGVGWEGDDEEEERGGTPTSRCGDEGRGRCRRCRPQGEARAWLGRACVLGCFGLAAWTHDALVRRHRASRASPTPEGGASQIGRWVRRRDWSRPRVDRA